MVNFDRQIKVIMESFDFERVHSTMVALDWEWNMRKIENRVPTLKEIKDNVEWQLNSLIEYWKGSPLEQGTGGFEVSVNKYAELGIKFVVEGGHYVSPEDGDRDYFGVR